MPRQRYTKKRRGASTRKRRSRGTYKNRGGAKKKWTTAIGAAEETFRKTNSLAKAREQLKKQAVINAQKLFGNVGESNRS